MHFSKIVAGVVLASGVCLAHAQDGALYGQVGYSMLNWKLTNVNGNFSGDVDQLSAYIGYELNPNLAIEGLLGMGLTEKNIANSSTVKTKINNTYGVFVKPKANLGEALSVHARLGYTSTDIAASDNTKLTFSGLAYGVGASYALSKAVNVSVAYDVYGKDFSSSPAFTTSSSELTGYTISVGYKF